MKEKVILSFRFLFIIFLGSMSLKGQLNKNMIAERFNMNAFNPAYVGSEGKQVFFSTRSSWQGVTGAPRVNYFSYSGNPKNNLSIGGNVISSKVFIDTRTFYTLDASYKLEMGGGKNIFLGLKAGASTKLSDIESLERLTGEANPAITDETRGTYPVLGFGFLYKSEKFYLSASIPNFLNPINFTDNISFAGNEKPITYFLTGTKISIADNTSLNPFFSTRFIPSTRNLVHFGSTFSYNNFIEVGMGYKSTKYIDLLFLLKTKIGLTLGYGYDFRAKGNEVEVQKSGSEIFAKYSFNIASPEKASEEVPEQEQ